MPIKRFFSHDNFERVKKDFQFLSKFVQSSYGEYELSIREDYFNIYYKGYSIGKIQPKQDETYMVFIHSKFIKGTSADNPKFYKSLKISKNYWSIILTLKQLHPFFQKKHLNEFSSRVKNEPSGEIGLEQAIITDNLQRNDLIIIDRQITDTELRGRRIDLLALKLMTGIKYQFIVLEIKLGNNSELKDQVAKQMEFYITHVEEHFRDYKECYEKHFLQKRELGLINEPKAIEITKPVDGEIIVGGYSGLANSNIEKLRQVYPNLKIKHLKYAL